LLLHRPSRTGYARSAFSAISPVLLSVISPALLFAFFSTLLALFSTLQAFLVLLLAFLVSLNALLVLLLALFSALHAFLALLLTLLALFAIPASGAVSASALLSVASAPVPVQAILLMNTSLAQPQHRLYPARDRANPSTASLSRTLHPAKDTWPGYIPCILDGWTTNVPLHGASYDGGGLDWEEARAIGT
jgi:hypothetical protein